MIWLEAWMRNDEVSSVHSSSDQTELTGASPGRQWPATAAAVMSLTRPFGKCFDHAFLNSSLVVKWYVHLYWQMKERRQTSCLAF